MPHTPSTEVSPTRAAVTPEMPAPEITLPRASMLNYLSVATTPTRVRTIAARSVKIISFANALIACVSLCALIYELCFWDSSAFTISSTADFFRIAKQVFSHEEPFPLIMSFATVLSVTQWCVVTPIRQGKRYACTIAAMTIFPMGLVLLFSAFGISVFAISEAFSIGGEAPQLWALLLLVPGLLALVLILLLNDLLSYLSWIAKYPVAEKFPISFISGKEIR